MNAHSPFLHPLPPATLTSRGDALEDEGHAQHIRPDGGAQLVSVDVRDPHTVRRHCGGREAEVSGLVPAAVVEEGKQGFDDVFLVLLLWYCCVVYGELAMWTCCVLF